jgi:hypothetical protein
VIELVITACLMGAADRCRSFHIDTDFTGQHQCMLFNQQLLAQVFTPRYPYHVIKRVECKFKFPDEREA